MTRAAEPMECVIRDALQTVRTHAVTLEARDAIVERVEGVLKRIDGEPRGDHCDLAKRIAAALLMGWP